jgi:hypothetical protein
MTTTFQMDRQTAFDVFVLRSRERAEKGGPDIGAVLTDAVIDRNILAASVWGKKHLPGGADNNPGFWELSFAACMELGALTVDPAYLTRNQKIQAFREFSNTIPADVYKKIFLNDATYVQFLSPEQRAVLASLGGQRGFRHLVNTKLPHSGGNNATA